MLTGIAGQLRASLSRALRPWEFYPRADQGTILEYTAAVRAASAAAGLPARAAYVPAGRSGPSSRLADRPVGCTGWSTCVCSSRPALADRPRGTVLIAGPACTGKSTLVRRLGLRTVADGDWLARPAREKPGALPGWGCDHFWAEVASRTAAYLELDAVFGSGYLFPYLEETDIVLLPAPRVVPEHLLGRWADSDHSYKPSVGDFNAYALAAWAAAARAGCPLYIAPRTVLDAWATSVKVIE